MRLVTESFLLLELPLGRERRDLLRLAPAALRALSARYLMLIEASSGRALRWNALQDMDSPRQAVCRGFTYSMWSTDTPRRRDSASTSRKTKKLCGQCCDASTSALILFESRGSSESYWKGSIK